MHRQRPVNRLYLLLLLFIPCLLSCKKDNSSSPDITKQLILPAGSAAVIDAGNQFAWKFFNTVLQQDPAANNKLISPLSIYTALSMVYNGANSSTRDSITKTLQLNGISIDDLNALNKALIEQMPSEDNKVTLNIANSIWYRNNGIQPLPDFLNTVQHNYDAQIQSLDFNNPSAVNTINSWVAQKTNNKIPSVLDKIDPSDIMFLINAIYFNGAWMHSFKTANTHNLDFHLYGGNTVSVPFMSAEMTLLTNINPSFTLVDIPYGGGKSYDMYILLPKKNDQPITDFAAALDQTTLTNALSNLDSQGVTLNLPKWEYAYNIDDMKPHLAQLGMGIAFGNTADLSNMYPKSPDPIYISRALHKTYIKVSEQGTEAAAATVIGVGQTTAILSPPVLTIDHPFIYIIREKQAGSILFLGIVNNPSKN
jgi:serpin B